MADGMNFDVNASSFLTKMEMADKNAMEAGEQGMNDVVDELIRISSEITPFYKGILQKSHKRKVRKTAGNIEAEVSYSVLEGDFNYALWIHEGVYELGEESEAKGGTTGMSGKTYQVGRKYLERPLKGERQAFYDHIAKVMKNKLRGR
ncbi:hypothetical protein [Halobacillus ihumii]|uniref:hypothetical protein n=1 Tax=Halobacillus ihumii TaxID=2686092 RepID=UPI0013D61008|nr:hypothetical protein [Halobacillus ihumii]